MFRPFVRVVRTPGAGLPVIACFLGALPIGMLGLGVLLLAQTTTGSFATAGAVSGALSIGNGLGLVAQGRLIDRYGQTRVLVVGGLLCPAMLVTFVVSATLHGPVLASAILAAAAGASIPATTSSMRVLWPRLVGDPVLRTTAYTVLATQFQIAMIMGPLVVSALVVAFNPAVAVLAAAGFACGGGLLFAAAPASRRPFPVAVAPAAIPQRWLSSGLYALLIAGFGGGVAAGMLNISVPAVAAEHRSAAFAGLLFAGLPAGELLGGLIYGGRARPLPPAHRLAIGQGVNAIAMGALALLTGTSGGMLAMMFAIGLCTAPTSIASSALLDDIAPTAALTRAYTVMVSVGLLGVATGNASGGAIGASLGTRPVLLIAGSVLGVVALWTVFQLRTLNSSYHSETNPRAITASPIPPKPRATTRTRNQEPGL